MATRGCTSRAASSEPQVSRVPCTVISGTFAFAFAMQRLKLRLKLRGSIGVPWRVVNTGPVFDPAIPGTLQVGVLLLLAEFQDGDAQIDERQGCLGGLGLDLAAMQLVADSLDLLSDIEIGGVEVDQIPGQAEDFALAQAHDEDQDEGGVEGLVCR